MRNPAPLVLALLLAVAATVIILRKPDDPPSETPPPSAEETAGADASAGASGADEPAADASSEPVWPQDRSDIPADPDAVFGQLHNGLRYLIVPNAEPPDRVSLRLHIAAGSLMEADDQQGIAHFLEHMVFNGSKNFTPDELIPRIQRLGIAFGAHVNAYTSFDETVYMLDLPDLSKETMDLGFTVMRDFGDGALLDAEEIEKERGVILSEKTSRDSVGYRLMQKQFKTLIPDSLVTRRFPIGEDEVIRTAPRERFVDFYRDYYTPERMTFVVVGDVDPAVIEARIKEQFGSMTNPEQPGLDPGLGTVAELEGLQPAIFADKEVTSTDLGLLTIDTFTPRPDTRERRISRMPLDVAHSILGTRFDRLAKEDGSPILGGSASRDELFNHLELGSIDVNVADDRWQDAVGVLEQEFRRAMEYGFTAAELQESRANLLNLYERAVETQATRRSDGLATGIARSINEGSVFTTPETDLEIARTGLESLTPEACHEAFVAFWKDKGMHLVLTTKQEPADGTELLARLYEESRSHPVDPPEEKEIGTFSYDLGEPGTVASSEEIADLGITRAVLSNGVTVLLKPTDFDKNSIRMRARIGHGKLVQPADKPGFSEFATAVIEGGGIADYSADDLQRLFAGRDIGFGFSVDEDSFVLAGATTPEDLDLQLRAMAAQIVAPGYRQEAVNQFRKAVPMIFQQLRYTAAGSMQKMDSWLHGGDPRFAFPDAPDAFLAYTTDDVKAWIDEHFAPAAIELSVVGDFEPEATLEMIARTFGALPERRPLEALPPAARTVDFPQAPQTKNYGFESQVPQGQSIVLWRTPGPRDNQRLYRRFNLLADILGDRLREELREKLGATYSPQAGASGSTGLEDFGYLIAMARGKPEDVERLAEVTVGLAATLAAEGASEDELDRARKPALADIEKSLRDNGYWLNTVLSGSTVHEDRFDLARSRQSDIESITVAEVNELAAKYLGAESALRVVIRSEAPAEPGSDE